MRVHRLDIAGYRSIRSLSISLGQLNVFTGPNGCGKSNLYRALWLLAQAAQGRFARAMADEGGMHSALWAGPRKTFEHREISLGVAMGELEFEFVCGLPPPSDEIDPERASFFNLDPLVKHELVRVGRKAAFAPLLMERRHGTVMLRDEAQRMRPLVNEVDASESVLSQIQQPHLYPELAALQRSMLAWRFYHHFRSDLHAPMRSAPVPVRTPVLSDDGADLANALRTIHELGDQDRLHTAIEQAFPGRRLVFTPPRDGSVALTEFWLETSDLRRRLSPRELSDGTLRYLCLLAALLSPRPAPLLALNEPETSIHADLLRPLAGLIVDASRHSQVWVTTHSTALAEQIESLGSIKPTRLELHRAATRIEREGSRAFEDLDSEGED